MLRTRICDLLGIEHPVVLGGMGTGTNATLVAAVSEGGGLGILGATGLAPDRLRAEVEEIRRLSDRPFGLNHLVFTMAEDRFVASLDLRPKVISTAWAFGDQDLKEIFDRAQAVGSLVMHMVSEVEEAERAAAAGADIIVAQGTEGGGHVGWMGTMPLVPMVVRAVAPIPVLAAGGVADGAGLAAALALGAEGVLLGTRFLATPEAPVPDGYKWAIMDSNGHDTVLTEIPDVASGRVWPGAMSRVTRNRFIERWTGREWRLRQLQREVSPEVQAARERDDVEEYYLFIGQTAGLIRDMLPADRLVRRIAAEAESIISDRLSKLVATPAEVHAGGGA
jgi:NAD(P)H-dependent flavin oxidoreductase YrpB (nitropropane dioxygenase family)